MSIITEFSCTTQRVACAVMAALIVCSVLLRGALGVSLLAKHGCSVTIRQIQ